MYREYRDVELNAAIDSLCKYNNDLYLAVTISHYHIQTMTWLVAIALATSQFRSSEQPLLRQKIASVWPLPSSTYVLNSISPKFTHFNVGLEDEVPPPTQSHPPCKQGVQIQVPGISPQHSLQLDYLIWNVIAALLLVHTQCINKESENLNSFLQ